jgi:AcrR family transcriptional regulator
MTGGTRKSTREKLVDSALYLFWLKGYEATPVAEILEHSGTNAGSFYHFFKRKEDLLLAVLDRYVESLDAVIVAPVRERFSDPIERVFGILEFYRKNLEATDCAYGCPIGRLALEIPPEQTAVHRRLADNFDGWTAAVERCLAEAGDALAAGVDLGTLSRFVLTVMEGGVMQARAHRSLAPFDASVAHLREYFRLLTGSGSVEGGGPANFPRDQADGFTTSPA